MADKLGREAGREGDAVLYCNTHVCTRRVPVVGGEHLRTYVGGDYAKIKRV
jgi:hypothetical protein